jgi:carboxyl-terminal processing protease
LRQNLKHDKSADLEKNKEELKELLEEEITKRYYFQKARYEASFKNDEDIQAALKLFEDSLKYKEILRPALKK